MLISVKTEWAGKRLDRVLQEYLGSGGLRAARRLIEDGYVHINHSGAKKGARLHTGDELEIISPLSKPTPEINPVFIKESEGYYIFYKPQGLHTISLAGRNNSSFEAMLAGMGEIGNGRHLTLLQRLDYGTSGLVCACVTEEKANAYKAFQNQGRCKKSYFTVLEGIVQKPVLVKYAIDSVNRKKVKVLERDASELYWTLIIPIWNGTLPGYDFKTSLARCIIHKGQRHQIRAHAASIGHPLAGDPLYGNSGRGNFLLEHYQLSFPGVECTYLHETSLMKKYFSNLSCQFAETEANLCIS